MFLLQFRAHQTKIEKMKGIVVFDDKSSIAFFSLDKELEKYITDRIKQLESEAGAGNEDTQSAYSDLRDALSAFFLPFFTSFDVLNSLKKAVMSITNEDGFLIVFRKFAESVYIAVSANEGDTEEVLTRKLFVFSRIVGLLYGPVDTRMNCPDVAMRRLSWKKLTSLLCTYERLYTSDQIFLLEAVEHVQFGQLQAAQDVVVKLAKECLESSNNGGLPNVQHAMLLVNTKLLTICGRSPQIPTADILLMTLLISNKFHEQPESEEEAEETEGGREGEGQGEGEGVRQPHEGPGDDQQDGRGSGDMTEQTFPEEMDTHTSGTNGRDTPDGARLEEGQESDAMFQTPRSTPAGTRRSSDPYEPDDPQFSTPRSSTVDIPFRTPSEEVDTPSVGGKGWIKKLYQFGGFGKRPPLYPEDARESLPPPQAKYVEQMVFLQPHQGHYIPHTLHCLEVYPGIVLVLITELHGSNLAGTICQTLLNLGQIFNNKSSNSGGQGLFDILEDAFRRINDMVKRAFQATASVPLRQCNIKVQNVWANLKTNRFRNFLEQEQQPSNARLEACGRDLMDKLVKLFEELYFTPKQREYDTNHVISTLIRKFSSLKRDYGDYLSLKGQLNIPMVSFYLGFPGMVHFILIDRSFDEMTTPSVSADNKTGMPYVEKLAQKAGEGAGVFLQKKIWTLVQRAQKFLALGYTSQTWMDQHFLYSYYIWVNVPNNVLGTPTRFYAPTKIRLSESSPPGVIGTSFYRDVKHSDNYQGYVYELYCIHQADVSIKAAAAQCRILAEQLWPASKEAIAPFSLIN